MKKLYLSLAIILFSWTTTLVVASNDFGDLRYYEKANPYVDLKAAIAKGDLRFIALRGYGTYIPGADNYYKKYSKYGYKVIKGTSDAIINYEHGRLIQIAQYYAEHYNRGLIEYLDNLKAKKIAEELGGYKKARNKLKIEEVVIGNINMLPYSLHTQLSIKNSSCVKQAWWFNPIESDKPKYDWNQFLKIFSRIDQVVCQHRWIMEWIGSGKNRTAEAQVFGIRPYTETEFHDFVEVPWKKTNLSSKPYYEILLREGDTWVGTIYISKDGNTAMITDIKGTKGNHWLDNKKISYHPKTPSVIVVDKSGNWRMTE